MAMETPTTFSNPPSGIPIAVAVISVYYAGIATFSVGAIWKTAIGSWQFPVGWAVIAAVLSAATAVGLAMLKTWARKLGRFTSALFALLGLWVATACVATSQPLLGIAASFFSGLHMAAYYYLRRPMIKAFFV